MKKEFETKRYEFQKKYAKPDVSKSTEVWTLKTAWANIFKVIKGAIGK